MSDLKQSRNKQKIKIYFAEDFSLRAKNRDRMWLVVESRTGL